jgi:predicted ferric reductase
MTTSTGASRVERGATRLGEHARPGTVCAIAAAIVFPLVPWLMAGPLDERFSGIATLKSVANLTALFGIAAWAVNLVLASRIRPVERAIGGLEHLYRLHRRLGLSVVALATAHVLFLTLHAEGDALGLYLPSAGWGTFTGVIAFVLLLGFVVASLARRLEYQTFTLVQRLLGVAFMLGAVHTFAVHSTPASSPLLTVYLAALTGAGCGSLGYRLLGGAFGIARSRYRVDEVRRLGEDLVEVVLLPVGRGLQYQAGQFVYATFHQSGIPQESHPFTIASAPDERAVRIAVKRLGDFTGSIMTLRSGVPVTLEGPFGQFVLRDHAGPQTWVAGGIGITPFLSWARSLDHPVEADLYYCTPGPDDAYFLDELREIADRFPAFRVIPVRKRSLGHLTVNDIHGVNPRASHGHVFICGPSVLIDNLTTGFTKLGIDRRRIHSENFDFRNAR